MKVKGISIVKDDEEKGNNGRQDHVKRMEKIKVNSPINLMASEK